MKQLALISLRRKARLLAVALFISFGCIACVPQAYDSQTEDALTALQREIDQFLVELERHPEMPECEYGLHERFYETTSVEISSLMVRNSARIRNDLTVRQIGLLEDSFQTLEELHRTGPCISAVQIEPLRRNFNATFTAILRLELAKRRG